MRALERRFVLPNCVCYLSFAAYRHWAQVKGERVALAAQATTIAKLFADAVGGRTAVVEVGGEKIDPCILEAVESGETDGVEDMIVLRLHRSSKAGA